MLWLLLSGLRKEGGGKTIYLDTKACCFPCLANLDTPPTQTMLCNTLSETKYNIATNFSKLRDFPKRISSNAMLE